MTNLEFYKEEIKAQCSYNIENSLGTSTLEDLASAINHISRQHNQGLVSCIAILNWLCEEYKEPILTEKEKEYLSNVIRPFRDRVNYIVKHVYTRKERDYEYLVIHYNDEGDISGSAPFPSFEKNSMYKGMELDKEYTLEELGL